MKKHQSQFIDIFSCVLQIVTCHVAHRVIPFSYFCVSFRLIPFSYLKFLVLFHLLSFPFLLSVKFLVLFNLLSLPFLLSVSTVFIFTPLNLLSSLFYYIPFYILLF